ncbi:MAG: hypothetical protein AAFP04_09425 [Myxococcota bacterium]
MRSATIGPTTSSDTASPAGPDPRAERISANDFASLLAHAESHHAGSDRTLPGLDALRALNPQVAKVALQMTTTGYVPPQLG